MHGLRHWSRQRSQKPASQCNDVMHSCVWDSRASLGILRCAHARAPFPLSCVFLLLMLRVAQIMETKKKRPNFSDLETQVLLEEVGTEQGLINSRLQAGTTIKKKRAVWQKIADQVNAVGGHNRDADACKKRWKDLKEAYHKKKKVATGTGGGPPPPRVPFEEVLDQLLGSSFLRTGVDDELDTYSQDQAGNTADVSVIAVSSTPLPSVTKQPCSRSATVTSAPESYETTVHNISVPLEPAGPSVVMLPDLDTEDDGGQSCAVSPIPFMCTPVTTCCSQSDPPSSRKVQESSFQTPQPSTSRAPSSSSSTSTSFPQDPPRTSKKRKHPSQQSDPCEESETELHKQFLKSQLQKNKEQTTLVTLLQKKTKLEIRKLELQIAQLESLQPSVADDSLNG
ncbi:uncharacterized protein LOC143284470 isoform X2 [Babylonia areolata]|uniref:uncharacterized protein LOC143284470 isoform X2 n=1 Tax=Babylonia areolata TaxID=304850 RepID=UPI003FD37C1A